MLLVKCVVACRNFNGVPDFYYCIVACTVAQYDQGDHYAAAVIAADEVGYTVNGYVDSNVVYDEYDGCAWLFHHFVRDTATIKVCHIGSK